MNAFEPVHYLEVTHGHPTPVDDGVVAEGLTCIFVNGQELATLMCTPMRLDELALGFLRSEGFIAGIGEVKSLHVSDNHCVDVWLDHDIGMPKRSVITAGCGGGVTFDDLSREHAPLSSTATLDADQVCDGMRQLMRSASVYNRVRGIHTSAIFDGTALPFMAEDVGRHNTIDRLWGQALRAGYETRDCALVASGRISSEMLTKALKMEIPVVISRTSPTSLSVALARSWNMTVIGYCRGRQFRVYSGEDRIRTITA